MHVLYDRHHKVSSSLKSHQNAHNSVKYEVRCLFVKSIESHKPAFMDISANATSKQFPQVMIFVILSYPW